MSEWLPILKGADCIKKHPTPILTKKDIPYEAEFIFNAGVVKTDGKYIMVFRNDYGVSREDFETKNIHPTKTSVGIAISENGIDGWRVSPKPIIHYDKTDM